MARIMAQVLDLHKRFGDNVVLDGVSFDVLEGETVAIIGPSGSGKSTLLRCMIGLERADGGTILIDGDPLMTDGVYRKDKESVRVCARMGMVFQAFNLFPNMNVMQNLIAAPMSVRKEPKTTAVERARKLLADVGLADKETAMPSSLSGGQKQRVAIARALMMQPEMLLFDEPTSSLDPQLTAEVLNVMRRLSQEHMTMVVVTHEMGFAREAADKVLFMQEREIIGSGTTEEIFEHPEDPRIKSFIQSIL